MKYHKGHLGRTFLSDASVVQAHHSIFYSNSYSWSIQGREGFWE